MKKTTLMLCAFIASVGVVSAQQVQMPAAYYNPSAPAVVQETSGPVSQGPRTINPNIDVPFTGSYGPGASSRSGNVVYDNGPYYNVAGTPNLSVLESVTLGMGTYGPSASFANGYSVADDVTLTETYEITSIDVFAYQTGSTAPSIDAVYMRVWDGDPSAGANIIWGDLTTNINEGAFYADANRVLEGDEGSTARQINRVTALTDGLILSPGTYWIEYSFEGTGSSGPWAPPIAILGQATTGNGMQSDGTTWTPLEDGGTFTPYGLPFVMYGDAVVGVQDNVFAGFNYYPNPSSDVINLSASKNIQSVSLFNLLGQKVKTVNVDATTSKVDLGGLASGNYLMKVTIDGKTSTYKITKK